ncbi:MAG: hypothetical protein K7J46_19455 [Bryobacter sp.]|nr:hypothetical protein [Bryobacter sp. CoA8 C33]
MRGRGAGSQGDDFAPSSPLRQAQIRPVVTIEGQPASIQFAGLTLGFGGLYRIHLTVPASGPDGNPHVVIRQGKVAANGGKLRVRK